MPRPKCLLRIRDAALLTAALLLSSRAASAEPHWIRARFGAFEAISDDGRRPAQQALSQFVQFSFALGTVLGQPDLKLDPPLRIVVFKTDKDMQAHCPSDGAVADALREGRDRLMACAVAEGQLPPALLRALTRRLIESNFPVIPGRIESGLETFFSTVQSNAVKVTWGVPPPAAERTRDWALIHFLVTQPDYAGRAKIYLHNLASGMDSSGASRNAFGEDGPKFDADVDRYYAAGVFTASAAPSRPLNPDRDLNSTQLTSDEGALMRADLLTSESADAYEALLKAGKQVREANEGLAILAMRDHAIVHARLYMEAARKAGTKNYVALTDYAEMDQDPEDAIDILKEALTVNSKYALAHWVFGEKLSDPMRRMMEWKQAVALAPRNYDWWAQYAQLAMDRKQYAEAARAWTAASLAAPDDLRRQQYLDARARIDEQRIAAEDTERRQDAADKAREIARLKNEAQKELADFEAKVNTRPHSAADAARTVDWYDTDSDGKITGTLVRVECSGKSARLVVKDEEGRTQTVLVGDPSQLLIQGGGKATLTCGNQPKATRVTVAYKRSSPAAKGVIGEATGLEFN